jgi:phosphatidate cytidylyltransferase
MAAVIASIILYAPKMIYDGIVLLIVMGGLYEFFNLVLPSSSIYKETGWIFGAAVAASVIFGKNPYIFMATLIGGSFVVFLIYMKHSTVLEGVTAKTGLTLLGSVYIGATIPFFSLLRDLNHGKALVFMGIACAAMSDTFALFGGKLFGKHKFAPLTSPNKTMEGFVAGFVGSLFAAYVVKLIGWHELPILHVVIVGLLIGFIGPYGDLIESLIKRDCHVKDSGSLIPGHGGILDRLDALIFTAPVLYLYARLFL